MTGEVLVVDTFDELKTVANKVKGKIVAFNEKWVDYDTTVAYREVTAQVAQHGQV